MVTTASRHVGRAGVPAGVLEGTATAPRSLPREAHEEAQRTRALAVDLLGLSDPAPVLAAWSREMAPADLARALHAVKTEIRTGCHTSMLRETAVDLTVDGRAVHLDLLLLPSIFAPETWGMTFLEGLVRRGGHDGRRMIELGTGSGWVSLALLRLTRLSQAIGVDLNPRAVLLSRLNAVLNGFDAGGNPLPDRLHERFRSVHSDLLAEPRRRGCRADLVVGCIPQVTAPREDLQSDQGLYDLSNYAVAQGLEEDAHGLGLNARALQESLHLLKPNGAVILNLAGRPGVEVLRQMFRRRGYEPDVIWRARVQQAADTDIRSMVKLEQRTGDPFSFFLHEASTESVSAGAAHAARDGGLPIFHDLLVVEGRPRSAAFLDLAASLGALGFEGLPLREDLSRAPAEQVRFVARLARGFTREARAPYPHEAGDRAFRQRVADFLCRSHDVCLSPEEVFAAPSRREVLHALLLATVERGEPVMVQKDLASAYGPALSKHGVSTTWVHDDEDELRELLPVLRPRLLLLAPRGSSEGTGRLLRCCEEVGTMLLLDDSQRFGGASCGAKSPVLALAVGPAGSRHLAVIVGLSRGVDAEIGILVSRHPPIIAGLSAAAEVTYSRISCFQQAYHAQWLDELSSFKTSGSGMATSPLPESAASPRLRPVMTTILSAPALARPAPEPDVIRLDYGENELPLPRSVQAGVLRGLLSVPGAAQAQTQAQRAAADYLRATRLPWIADAEVVLDRGAMPLLFNALRAMESRLGRAPRVLLPQASYGMFPPLVQAAGGVLRSLPTEAPDFLVTPEALEGAPDFDVLLLTNPANPSGAAYTAQALRALIRTASRRGARVILDEVFGLLADLAGPLPTGQDRWAGLTDAESESLLVICSASKELAAGGLRLGLAGTSDSAWRRALAEAQLDPLPHSVLVTAAAVLGDVAGRAEEITALREGLCRRRALLARGLRSLGFGLPDETGRGGLFLFPDVAPLAPADPEAFVLELEAKARVRLNAPSWSGTRSHARACFAVAEETILEALERLRTFLGK